MVAIDCETGVCIFGGCGALCAVRSLHGEAHAACRHIGLVVSTCAACTSLPCILPAWKRDWRTADKRNLLESRVLLEVPLFIYTVG